MLIIGILAIFAFIFAFAGNFVQPLNAVSWVLQIVILIIIFSALDKVKEANKTLNNKNLSEFRSKIRKAYILFIIGLFFFYLGIGLLTVVGAPIGGIVTIIIGVILLIISAIFRIQGWGALSSFFKNNRAMFPENIGGSASTGATLLMVGAILYLTIIGWFIGIILEIIGCFILSTLKNLGGAPAAQPTAQPTPTPAPGAAAEPTNRFCPNCGGPVTGTEKFCSACGSEIS